MKRGIFLTIAILFYIYFVSAQSFAAIDKEPKWKFNTSGLIMSSPAIDSHGTIYVVSSQMFSSSLIAINPDGTSKWNFDLKVSFDEGFVTVDNDGQIYVDGGNYFYVINPDGTEKWKYQLTYSEWFTTSAAISCDGTVLVGKFNGTNGQGSLLALDVDQQILKWKFDLDTKIASSPVVDSNGVIYFGTDNGYLYALESNGQRKWQYKTDGIVRSTPAIDDDGTIYFGSEDGYLYALNPNGTLKWKKQLGFTDGYVKGWVVVSPVIDKNGTVYASSSVNGAHYYLYALDPNNGDIKWTFEANDHIYTTPVIGNNNTIYFGSYDKYLYAVTTDGVLKWKSRAKYPLDFPCVLDNTGMLYATDINGVLYAFETDSTGPCDSAWPQFQKDSQNTGLKQQGCAATSPINITDGCATFSTETYVLNIPCFQYNSQVFELNFNVLLQGESVLISLMNYNPSISASCQEFSSIDTSLDLHVPCLRLGVDKYSLVFKYISSNPVLFQLKSIEKMH